MLEIEKTVLPSAEQWMIIIEGMRNPMNSWDKSDSLRAYDGSFVLGGADYDLMERLAKGGSVHAKYRRMIPVYVTIDAPLYWWKEFDTYKVGTVCNSCSTMHKIHAKEFTLDDFSYEHLKMKNLDGELHSGCVCTLRKVIDVLNGMRTQYLITKNKFFWWQMIQLLPTSYNQKRTIMLNYEVLVGIYRDRKDHKLDEWHVFCDWIRSLPYSEFVTGGE